ncbi:MAG: DsbA family protein [Nocardioidaceae bacterium]
MNDQPERVTFYFDPACPWTWRTSRWLVDTASRHGVPVSYRAFELSNGASLDTVPEQYRAGAVASRQLLRAVEMAHAGEADGIIEAVYTANGTAIHDEGQDPSTELVRQSLTDAGGQQYLGALSDDSLDASVASARRLAQEHSGDDTGSPVLVLTTAAGERGFFGPVLAPTPTGEAADRIWDLLLGAAAAPEFFELKCRRTSSP